MTVIDTDPHMRERPLAYIMRSNQGEASVVAGPFPYEDDEQIEDAIVAVIEEDGVSEWDRFIIVVVGSTWCDANELEEEYLKELIEEAEEDEEVEDV